jgi:hypothetical protein
MAPGALPRTIEEQKSAQQWCARYLSERLEATRPASPQEIVVLLDGLCVVYGYPENFDRATAIYVDLLEYPLDILKAAVAEHMRTSKWFPKPAELIVLCEPAMFDRRADVADARADLAYVSQELGVSREWFYRNQHIGDGHGTRGSSALRARDPFENLNWTPSSEYLEELARRPKIPVPGEAE